MRPLALKCLVLAIGVGSAVALPALAQSGDACELAKLFSPEPAVYQNFGRAVATNSTSVFVAGWDSRIRVYSRTSLGSWAFQKELTEPIPDPNLDLGRALAVDGARLAATFSYKRSVALFEQIEGAWTYAGLASATSGYINDLFGDSVALDGNTLIVGAPLDNVGGAEAGAAYVFRFDGMFWKQEAFLKATKPTGGDRFGCSVSVSNDVAVVGAFWDDQLGWNAGSAYVFERNDMGQWQQTAKLLPADGGFLDHFGAAVAIRGDRMLVGSRGADGVIYSTGAVYVFERSGQSAPWTQVGKLIASDGVIGANLGAALSFDGFTLFVGAPGDWAPEPATGAAYVFVVNVAGEWSQVGKVFPSNLQAQTELGHAVASCGDLAVLGNRFDDEKGWNAGAAWVYAVGPDTNNNGLMDPCECPGDINKDWIVDQQDLGALLAAYGTCEGNPGFNAKANLAPGPSATCPPGVEGIDQADLGVLLANYGNICP